jgi:hypothetical protein
MPHPTRVHRVFRSWVTGARGYLASIEQEDGVKSNPDAKQQIVLAFRGTVVLNSWILDLLCAKTNHDAPDEFRRMFPGTSATQMENIFSHHPEVHGGFYKVTMSIFKQVMK